MKNKVRTAVFVLAVAMALSVALPSVVYEQTTVVAQAEKKKRSWKWAFNKISKTKWYKKHAKDDECFSMLEGWNEKKYYYVAVGDDMPDHFATIYWVRVNKENGRVYMEDPPEKYTKRLK